MRGLDLESTDTLLDLLMRRLGRGSNRLAALASDAPHELADAIGAEATDLDRCAAVVEVLLTRRTLKKRK